MEVAVNAFFAIKANVAASFLSTHGIFYELRPLKKSALDLSKLVRFAESVTVQVKCWKN